jgi:outer membrane lipoprotein SlyB
MDMYSQRPENFMNTPTPRLHPLVATAALAVTTFSLAGIAALTGLLPLSRATATAEIASAAVTVPPEPTFRAPPATEPVRPAIKPAARAATKPAHASAAVTATPADAVVRVAETLPAPAPAFPAPVPCADCGVIDSVRELEQEGTGSGIGAVAGGVLGGILGNQVGKGNGNKLATILGAVGGAYAGHQVEKSRNKGVRYEIGVRMADGTLRTVTQDSMPPWRIGERVRVENGTLQRDAAAPPQASNYDRI